jgi:hypothetical protein
VEDRQLKLKVGDQELETLNWSVGGFMAHGLEGLETKDRFTGVMQPQDGPSSEFTGQVTRVDENGARTVRFVEVDLATLIAMQQKSEIS